jgi:hypothetical protein
LAYAPDVDLTLIDRIEFAKHHAYWDAVNGRHPGDENHSVKYRQINDQATRARKVTQARVQNTVRMKTQNRAMRLGTLI